MGKPKDGFEFLAQLQAETQEKPKFSALRDYMARKAVEKAVPMGGIFELTPLCNFDCKMCYTHLTKEQMGGKDLLTVAQWKGLIHDAWEAGMLFATLTGGECLTYPGFKELYLYLRSLGVMVTVLTNGALLNDEWIRFFQEHPPTEIMITLYGDSEETYEQVTGQRRFADVVKNIRKLQEAEIPLHIAITPSKYMGESVFEVIRTAEELNVYYTVNTFLMDPKEETGRSGQQHDIDLDLTVRVYRYLNELKGRETKEIDPALLPPVGSSPQACEGCGLTCKAGRAVFTIEWDGRMYPCSSIRNIWGEPLKDGFRAAWESINKRCLAWPKIPACIDCPYQSVCINCAVEKQRFAEPGKQPLALCERTRYLVQRGVKSIPACE